MRSAKAQQSKLHSSVLVTGVAGSGKSTVCAELKRRRYKAYDIEQMPSFFDMVHKKTGRVVHIWDNRDLKLTRQLDWVCDEDKLKKLVRANKQGIVFYCGVSSNLDSMWSLFDRVILLRASPNVLRHRLATRTTNDFARDPRVRRWLLHSTDEWENHVRQRGAIVVDADQTLREVTNEIIRRTRL